MGVSFLNLSQPRLPAVFNSQGSPASVFCVPGVPVVSCPTLCPSHLASGQRLQRQDLLCPDPFFPADPLLFTVQNLRVSVFYIMHRFCHHVLQGNRSLITRCGHLLVESQGPLRVLLSSNWFLEGEEEERTTFSTLDSSWFSSLLPACPRAGDPITQFPIFGARCRRTTGSMRKDVHFYSAGSQLGLITVSTSKSLVLMEGETQSWCRPVFQPHQFLQVVSSGKGIFSFPARKMKH